MAQSEDDVEEESAGERGAYPYYSLQDSETFIKEIHKAGGWEVSLETAYAHLYKSGTPRLNRWWKYKMMSAREFGLLERTGRSDDAKVKLTPLGRRLVMPEGDIDAASGRRAAFMSSPLYRKLVDRYAGGPLPAASGLTNVMVREYAVASSVAPVAAAAFEASVTAAGLVGPNGKLRKPDSERTEPSTSQVAPGKVDPDGQQAERREQEAVRQLPIANGPPEGFIEHRFNLRRGLVVHMCLPEDLTQSEVARLSKWLATLPLEDESHGEPP
jgi:hypothetical protein